MNTEEINYPVKDKTSNNPNLAKFRDSEANEIKTKFNIIRNAFELARKTYTGIPDTTAMLGLNATIGTKAKITADKSVRECKALPPTEANNWELIGYYESESFNGRVSNFTDLLAIPSQNRWRGMMVYVQDVANDYEDEGWFSLTGNVNTTNLLDNANWKPLITNVPFRPYSGSSFPVNDGTPEEGPILQGYTFTVVGGSQYRLGTLLTARIDNPGSNPDNWSINYSGVDYTPMNVALRTASINTPDDSIYVPNVALMKSELAQKAGATYVDEQLNLKASINYVHGLLDGLKWKQPVRLCATGNITLSGLQTIDTIAGNEDDSILVPFQADPRQNGIYLMKNTSWVRRSDADNGVELQNATVNVSEGATYANKDFTQTTDNVVLGTSNIVFIEKGVTASFAGLIGSPSDNAALSGALAAKANDNEVVKIAGNQDISGVKNFNGGSTASYVAGTTITGNITLDASYANKFIRVSGAAVITVPNNVFSANQQIRFLRQGSGEVSFVNGAGHTINSAGNRYRIAERYSPVELIFDSASISTLIGGTKE